MKEVKITVKETFKSSEEIIRQVALKKIIIQFFIQQLENEWETKNKI